MPDTTNKNQSVYIIDDNESIRGTLQYLLEFEGFQTKAFATATDFLTVCDDEIRGCILLDLKMPEISGLELQHWLIENRIDIPIIFLSGSGDIPLSSQAFRAGALDFLEKPFDIETLLERIREALQRDSKQWHIHHRQKLLQERLSHLSPREKEAFKWVSAGYSSKEIAKIMAISNRTVEIYRASIMVKMKAESLADLVSIAIELDI